MLHFQENIPLAPYTTMAVGGSARYFVEVYSEEDIVEALRFALEKGIPYYLFGNGSNILFLDEGYDGLVIHNKLDWINTSDTHLTTGSGALLNTVIMQLSKDGVCGFERLFGVPGTIGGAIFQNATAYDAEITKYLVSAKLYNVEEDIVETWKKEDFDFSYRNSRVKRELGKYIILSAKFELIQDEISNIQARIAEVNKERYIRPVGKSVGSFFTNPKGEKGAGQLIEEAGLKGMRVGGAEISEIHANYIMNVGNATTSDILKLAEMVKEKVKENSEIELKEEVRVVKSSLTKEGKRNDK